MDNIYLAVVWHHHQPPYTAPGESTARLPWARLHGIKDYVGMAMLAKQFPEFHHTFNLTPCLVQQLQSYAYGEASDRHLELTRKHAGDLDEAEAEEILDRFFAANYDTMISPHEGYRELYSRRELQERTNGSTVKEFSRQDLRDLQTWGTLTWFHPLVFREREQLHNLLKKGNNFTEADKQTVLEHQDDVLKRIVPLYRELQEDGVVELTTSPLNHPILPLLLDQRSARVALPEVPLPDASFDGRADAVQQVERALKLHEQQFGRRPAGMWPSEGSISPGALGVMAEAGVEWAASDEEVLRRSLSAAGRESRDRCGPEWLYAPHAADVDGAGDMSIVFRDHVLSDRIGFQYASYGSGEEAAQDLVDRIRQVGNLDTRQPPLVSIILDGENPWEHYSRQGLEFLSPFYRKVCQDEVIQPVTVSEYLERFGPADRLDEVHSGSWIGADFSTWIGEDEKNRGWEMLARARSSVKDSLRGGDGKNSEKVREAIYRAEASDWFWWYGVGHTSALKEDFDWLFRSFLTEAYRQAGRPVPDELEQAISVKAPTYTEPSSLLDVEINGWVDSYYEWLGAGHYDSRRETGSMRRATGKGAEGLHYGYEEDAFMLRIDPAIYSSGASKACWTGRVLFSNGVTVGFNMHSARGAEQPTVTRYGDGGEGSQSRSEAACGRVFELRVPWTELELDQQQEVDFHVQLFRDEELVQRLPSRSNISIRRPGEDFGKWDWSA